MGIRSFIRDRKQVVASRATESGRPAGSEDLWAPSVSKGQYNVNGRAVNGKENYNSNWGDSKGYGSAASNAWGND